MYGDTIAAIATAPGPAGVAVVRVSGPDALKIGASLCGGRALEPGRIAYRRIVADGRVLDDAVVLAFAGGHSYTGEPTVEFQCHGGAVAPRRILEACFSAGARLALRGEFTQRAFVNGRLDYAAAEAVLDLINARTDRAADNALARLHGDDRRELTAIYEAMLNLSTRLEYALDVDEEEMPDDFMPRCHRELDELRGRVEAEIRRRREGILLREGALVVLAGPPNSGKSSLMNALLGIDRAIVSDVAGTTRDSIEESIAIDGWPIRLVDTAGLRGTSDAIEAEGVDRAEKLMAAAQVVLWLGAEASDALLGDERVIRVHSKCDLGRGEGVNVSAKTGEGLGELRAAIVSRLEKRVAAADADGQTTGERMQTLLKVAAGLAFIDDPVLLAGCVRSAAETLAVELGAVYSADLLDRLFSRFCVGK